MLKKSLVAVWLVVATVTLAYAWYYNPNIFPEIPEEFSIWLTNLFSAQTAEDVATIGLVFGLVVSALLVSGITFLALYVWCLTKKSR